MRVNEIQNNTKRSSSNYGQHSSSDNSTNKVTSYHNKSNKSDDNDLIWDHMTVVRRPGTGALVLSDSIFYPALCGSNKSYEIIIQGSCHIFR